ncbi:Glycosyl transferase family 2 [Sanguibacter gelidistatuariae]|uniref:Glycosyl transferase family 2 n=1 Tax=Sanguibacter gelidistatuariae TaxID=1814289 RepID=A0A1G6VZ98_9MICO|nr:glycosyltransferase family 2 protein [Sanguibacter gelidistatuariae]SDD58146.1 Glycosyl transferase family 2 [Sanguibacter gelidistatuariae]
MKLVATLLVRDEADVVRATIEHHLGQGVELIIAMDNGSVDGTIDILREYERDGRLELTVQPDHDYRQSEWVTQMARRASTAHGADWVINLDADEFWVPRDRRLRLVDALAAVPDRCGTVVAMRTDLVGLPERGNRPWTSRLRWRNLRTVSERGTPLAPKSCHRGDPDVVVPQGNHGAQGPLIGPPSPETPLDIYHVPLRSWEQFRRKIDNGGSAYAANVEFGPEVGWHWRADYERLRDGTLERTYRDRCLSRRSLVSGILRRTLVRDRWLEFSLATLVDRLEGDSTVP